MPVVRLLMIILGTISLVLGIIGAFLPLLPTTPFLLLTAFLYYRSSPVCYEWLLRQPYLGKYIRNFRENKVIPIRAKILSLSLMWGSMLYCIFCVVETILLKILLLIIAIGVTWHIASFKNK